MRGWAAAAASNELAQSGVRSPASRCRFFRWPIYDGGLQARPACRKNAVNLKRMIRRPITAR